MVQQNVPGPKFGAPYKGSGQERLSHTKKLALAWFLVHGQTKIGTRHQKAGQGQWSLSCRKKQPSPGTQREGTKMLCLPFLIVEVVAKKQSSGI